MDYVDVAATDDFADKQMIGTMIDGVRVAVAHIGEDFFAFGAVCTHEKANLDEGVISEHQVYCPLHFSSFDVRTGEVLAPPAEHGVPTYPVKVEDGRVYVGSQPGRANGDAAASLSSDAAQSPDIPVEAATGDWGPASNPRRRTWRERIFSRLEESPRVDALNVAITARVSPFRRRLEGNFLLDLAHGSRWLGHALHPALSDIPIGLGVASVVVSIWEPGSGAESLLRLGTLVGGLGAAATGVVDWSVAEGGDRRLGLVHGLINIGALGLIGVAVACDVWDQALAARLLGGLAVGVMGAGAYLGGHLVFGRGVMVDHTAWTTGPRDWTSVVAFDQIADGKVLAAQAGDREVLLYREDEEIYALDGLCSHAGARLGLGKCEDGIITCPWHGSQFRLKDGTVNRGPACFEQPVLSARIVSGQVEVREKAP